MCRPVPSPVPQEILFLNVFRHVRFQLREMYSRSYAASPHCVLTRFKQYAIHSTMYRQCVVGHRYKPLAIKRSSRARSNIPIYGTVKYICTCTVLSTFIYLIHSRGFDTFPLTHKHNTFSFFLSFVHTMVCYWDTQGYYSQNSICLKISTSRI